MLQGAVPVKATVNCLDMPLQMGDALVLMTAVGLGLTVTTAIPVLSVFWEVQFASFNAVTVKDLLSEGDTLNM